MAPFTFDRSWHFDATPEELWETLRHTDRFTSWWSWLRRCDVAGLESGAVARCVVQAPLPYALRFDVHVVEVDVERRVVVRVRGDLEGPASLAIEPEGSGCRARLAWSLELRAPMLRRLAIFGRPAMSWAHDRIVAVGIRQFESRALRDAAGRPDPGV